VLTGEAGSGKTAALRADADGLDASRHTLIYLPNPQAGVRGIRRLAQKSASRFQTQSYGFQTQSYELSVLSWPAGHFALKAGLP